MPREDLPEFLKAPLSQLRSFEHLDHALLRNEKAMLMSLALTDSARDRQQLQRLAIHRNW
jgi:hypothetical protein